jgi:hypothetical protein
MLKGNKSFSIGLIKLKGSLPFLGSTPLPWKGLSITSVTFLVPNKYALTV